MDYAKFAHAKTIALGKEVIRMTTAAGSGHPSSALSIMHIVVTLMYDMMRWDPADPWHPASDRLILSEGHAVPAIYAAYADLGGMIGKDRRSARRLSLDDLATLRETDSVLDGHPNPAEGFPFFDAATGSLGQGLSVAAGLAITSRLRKLDRRFFVIIGDGESREGQVWEAMDFIAERGLAEVTAVFNCNGQGQADYVSPQQSAERIAAKAEAFGWRVVNVDGHDPDALKRALAERGASAAGIQSEPGAPATGNGRRERPLAIIARTEKGWGCDALKDKSNHGKPVAKKELDAALAMLDGMNAKLSVRAQDADTRAAIKKPPAAEPLARCERKHVDFATAIAQAGMESALAKNALATRRAYGAALAALAEVDPRIVALDGDVSNSTFAEIMAKKHPERFIECKIAEQNMVSAAVGLAAAGFIPFVSSFAKFIARAYDQIEMAQITRANVKLVGSHAGVTLAADGPSQMSMHDVAYFRSAEEADDGRGRPVCVSFHPADAVAAYHCTWLMAAHEGMCYMRTHRPDVPLLYSPETKFEIGGSHRLVDGDAVTIVSAGYMVHECKRAVEKLAGEGIRCALFDTYSFPLQAEPILASGKRTGGRILVVEDNYVGGLAGAVAEAAARYGEVHVESMTCRRIPKSTRTTDDVLAYVGLGAGDIAARIRSFLM